MDRRSSLPGRSFQLSMADSSSGRGVLRQFRPRISEQWLSNDTRTTSRSAARQSSGGLLRDARRTSLSGNGGAKPVASGGRGSASRPPGIPTFTERKLICPECLASFETLASLESHIERLHGDGGNIGVLSCPHCSEAIKHRTNLHRHIRVKHDERSGRHHCRKCGFSCSTEADLEKHKEKHRVCPYCKVVMESGTGLAKHMQNCRFRSVPRR